MKSKIKSVQGNGTKNGWLNYEIELEDSTTAVRGFKEDPTSWLTPGKDVEYELNEKWDGAFSKLQIIGTNHSTVQPSSNQFKADPDKQRSIERQAALKNSIEYHVAIGFSEDEENIPPLKEMIQTAKYIYNEFLKG